MQIYLASRYSRRLELCEYRKQLVLLDHTVTSRWLNGEHQISDTGVPIGEHGEKLVEGDDGSTDARAAWMRHRFATEDFVDVITANLLIAFTEVPRSGHSRGGRHVELGIALGRMMPVWIVGPRENLFCWMEDVQQFDSFGQLIDWLEFPKQNPKSLTAGTASA